MTSDKTATSFTVTGLSPGTTYFVVQTQTNPHPQNQNTVSSEYSTEVSAATATKPTVTTTSVSGITASTVMSGGEVVTDGGDPVTARGVCWSTSEAPTTDDSHTTDGTGTGVFTSSLTGLIPGTSYHLRAYATNSIGTAYGNEITFQTLTLPEAVETIISFVEGLGLDQGVTRSLTSLLELILPIEADKLTATVNQLNAFIHHVNAHRGKAIDEADANALISMAQALIDTILAMPPMAAGQNVADLDIAVVPSEFLLMQNYPNPFNSQTVILFDLPREEHVRIEIVNLAGRRINTLLDAVRSAGHFSVTWDGRDNLCRNVSGGLYLCRFRAGTYQKTMRMLFLK
jgi:hypothetical protein